MNIEEYGFKDEEMLESKADIVARIVTTYRDRYEVVCNKGRTYARLKKGTYYDNPDAIYPTIGDFVLINWNDMGNYRNVKKTKFIF